MKSTPTAAAVMAAVLASKESFGVFAEDGSTHAGHVIKRTDRDGSSAVVIEFVGDAGTFLVAVCHLDLSNPADAKWATP